MTDSELALRSPLCFLSTLPSQKVPEKSDLVLRCTISGQPKPQVTWYKNGHAISESNLISNYEILENQYIHMLHLYSCTKNDAAVYQISARNCFGMICCSAFIEVECFSENPQLNPNLREDAAGSWKNKAEMCKKDNSHQVKELFQKEGNVTEDTSPLSDCSFPKFRSSCLSQLQSNNDNESHGLEKDAGVKSTIQTQENCSNHNYTEENAFDLFSPKVRDEADELGKGCSVLVHSKPSRLIDDYVASYGHNDEVLPPSRRDPKIQKYISCSMALPEETTSIYPVNSSTTKQNVSPEISSEDSDTDFELCPEINLTCTEEFSDDDLEYLECSDVMTDYSNAIWQEDLRGNDPVFLLERDDEETKFREACLGGCEHFHSEMACQCQVSDNTVPMDTTIGFCGHHSKLQEVAGRSSLPTYNQSTLQPGMTLILGHPQDETSPVKDQERYKLPVSSTANDSDQPGMKGENADSHQAGEYLAIDSLMNMDKTPGKMMSQTHELEKSVINQPVEKSAEKSVERDLPRKKGSQKLVRVRRPGTKGKPKKLNTNLKENATDGRLNLPGSGEVRDLELRQGDTRESFHEEAEVIHLNSQFHGGEYDISTQSQQETETLPTPTESLLIEGEIELKKKGKCAKGLLETDLVVNQHAHSQVQREKISAEGITKSHLQGSSELMRDSESLWKASVLRGTIINSRDILQSISEGDGSLTHHMQLEICSPGPQHYEKPDQENSIHQPGSPREDKSDEQISSEARHENALDCELLARDHPVSDADLGEQESLYVTLAEASYSVLTVAHSLSAPRDAEEPLVMVPHEIGGPEIGCGSKDLPHSMLCDDYLPQEKDSVVSELAEGQCETSDLCLLRDVTMERFSGAQDTDPPFPMCENREAGGSANITPYPMGISTGKVLEGAYENDTKEKKMGDKNSVKEFARILKTDQGKLSPSNLVSGHVVSTKYNCLSQLQEAGDERLLLGTADETETPSLCSIIAEYPKQKSNEKLSENIRGSQVPSEGEETPTLGTVVKGHQVKYLAVSIAQNHHLEGAEESFPGVPAGSIAQLPSDEQLTPAGSDCAANATEQLTLKDPLGMTAHLPHPQLLQTEDFLSNSLGAIAYGLTSEIQGPGSVVDKNWEEDCQGKVRDSEQNVQKEIQPYQGSFSEDSLQDDSYSIPDAQGQSRLLPLGHSSDKSEKERWNLGGSGVRIAMTSDKEETQASQKAPSSLENLLEEANKNAVDSSQGDCESGVGQKAPTLTDLASEPSPPMQIVDLECKVSPEVLDNVGVLFEELRADNSVQKLDTSERDTSTSSNQSDSAIICFGREIPEKKEVRNHGGFCIPSLQYLKDSIILESSVDPVGEKETCTTASLFQGALGVVSEVSGKKNTDHAGKAQVEGQPVETHPALLTQFLTHPRITESSVDSTDGAGVTEYTRTEKLVTSESTLGVIPEERNLNKESFSQKLKIKPALLQVPRHKEVEHLGEGIPCVDHDRQSQEGMKRDLGEPDHKAQDNTTECTSASLVLSNSFVKLTTDTSRERDTSSAISQIYDEPVNGLVELQHHEWMCTGSKECKNIENEHAKHLSPASLPSNVPVGLTFTSFLEVMHFAKDGKREEPTTGEPKATNSLGSPIETLAFIPTECTSETSPKCKDQIPSNHCPKGSLPGNVQKAKEEKKHCHIMPPKSKVPETLASASEEGSKKQEMSGTGHLAEGVKKKILSKVAALKMRLEEKERARKNSIFSKKIPKLETFTQSEEKKDPKRSSWKREGKAPVLLKKIQAEMFPDHSGNIKLSCQFAEIHEDSTISWTKDSKLIARVQRSAGDNSTVSLAIVQASKKDQGLYYCCLRNSYGKVTAEFNLTSEVLGQLSSHQDIKEFEEIEFSQLIFREDFISDSYFGGNLHGQIATEELHFGEGIHRKAFRSKVMQGLTPVFSPGHACVLKVHNAIAYGTKNNDELVQKNYKLAAQECYVQNTARQYAKIYAAEAQPLEGFGEVPE
ncbi:alpha-protein kinase 2 isoform X2 [Notamacropus eugenii]